MRVKKYQDVYCQLKADIYTKYPLGSFLPPELELMQIYNTSRTTIRRAVSILRDEHILDVRQGRGTQVLLENYSYQKDPPFFHNVSSIVSNYLIEQKDNQFKIEGCIVVKAVRCKYSRGMPGFVPSILETNKLHSCVEIFSLPVAKTTPYFACIRRYKLPILSLWPVYCSNPGVKSQRM